MKFKIHTSTEEKMLEISKIKTYMEIGIFILAAIEILCELFSTKYFDYIIMSISFMECGLFIYGFMLNFNIIARSEFHPDRCNALADFHNTFMTSIIVPLIFIFSNDNTSFENTRISDSGLIKKITVIIVLIAMFYYKSMHYSFKKVVPEGLTEEQKKLHKRRALLCVYGGLCIDAIVMCFVFVFFLGALNKDEQIANFSMIFAILIAANIVLLNRIEEKKHIFKISFIALTVIYIFFGTYNVYLEKSVSDYQFEKTDYSYTTTLADGGKVEQYCRFENGEKDKEILKYVIVYTDSKGSTQAGSSVYEFTSSKPSKGFLKWYDIEGNAYIKRNDIEKNEIPAVISVSHEKTDSDDNFPLSNYLDNSNYTAKGKNGDEREWIVVGENYIKFRQTQLNETTTLPEDVELIFDEISFK